MIELVVLFVGGFIAVAMFGMTGLLIIGAVVLIYGLTSTLRKFSRLKTVVKDTTSRLAD